MVGVIHALKLHSALHQILGFWKAQLLYPQWLHYYEELGQRFQPLLIYRQPSRCFHFDLNHPSEYKRDYQYWAEAATWYIQQVSMTTKNKQKKKAKKGVPKIINYSNIHTVAKFKNLHRSLALGPLNFRISSRIQIQETFKHNIEKVKPTFLLNPKIILQFSK